jgi:hypothetical protein
MESGRQGFLEEIMLPPIVIALPILGARMMKFPAAGLTSQKISRIYPCWLIYMTLKCHWRYDIGDKEKGNFSTEATPRCPFGLKIKSF